MAALRSTTARREAQGEPSVADGDPTRPTGPGLRPPSGPQEREVAAIARDLHELRPEVPIPEIEGMVLAAFERLGTSKVQGFRLILAERSVRRSLAIEGSEARKPLDG